MTRSYPSNEELMELAVETAGADDFGSPTFLEGLTVLRESLIRDVPYRPEDQKRTTDLILRRLVNRLTIESWFRANPEAETAPILDPISIIGLPRTGTTALGNMMSLDTRFRPLRPWEQEDPCPPPEIEHELMDPRRLAYRTRVKSMLRDQPAQAAMHIWEIDATMEDTEVLGLQFRAQQMTMPVWSYHAWWREGDMRETFAYHARVLRLLQSHRPPNRWLFKAPHHKFHLDQMVDAYPTLRFIFMHRDPALSVPSYASFVSSLYPPDVVEQLGKRKIGQEIHRHLLNGMEKALWAREKLGPDRFLDVQHADLLQQPLSVLARIYEWLGMEFTDELATRFEGWGKANGSGSQGSHNYSPADFGLTPNMIRSDYQFYYRKFDNIKIN